MKINDWLENEEKKNNKNIAFKIVISYYYY